MDSKFLLPWGDAVTYTQMNPHVEYPHPDLLSNRVHWQHQEIVHVHQQLWQTHHRSNTEIIHPKLKSFPFPVQDRNPVCSVLLSLTTPVLALLLMLPLLLLFKCYPFGEDHSHLNLNNMGVYNAYRAPLESKAPQDAEPCRIRRIWNKLALQKSWLNLRIRGVCCFL